MHSYYLKQFCGRFLFLILILLFISSSAIPCTIGGSTPTKFDSSKYIFIGRIISYVGPYMSDTLHQNFYGLLVEIIDPVYLPKTPRKYFEVFDYSLSSDCRLGSYDLKTNQYLHPLNKYIRVIAKETKYLTNNINPDNIRLDLDPFNNPQISEDYPDIPQLHSSHDSNYDYRYMSEDSSAKFLSSNKWITEKDKDNYHNSYWWLGEFELRKDLYRLASLKDTTEIIEIFKRLAYYPHYNQTQAKVIVPRYIDNPKLRVEIINLFTPVKSMPPPDTTLHSELPSSLKSRWIQTNGPFGGDFNLLKLITNRSGINYLFAGATDHGLYRSSDNGRNWIRITIGLTYSNVTTFFSHNNYLFVGSGEGVFRSSDDGLNWERLINGLSTTEKLHINCFTSNSKFIFAGADTKGIFRSSDDGNSWAKVNPAVNQQQVWSICAEGSFLFAGTTVGVYVSIDNGDNWFASNNGLPTNMHYPNGKIRLPVTNIVYINGKLFTGLEQEGLFVSIDNGKSWKVTGAEFHWFRIFGITGDSENLFLSSDSGVLLSRDSGTTWISFKTEPIKHCFISEVYNSNLYACSSNGIFLSTDFGKNWINCNNGLSRTDIHNFALKGNTLFAASGSGLFKSNDNGKNWDFLSQNELNYGISDIAVNEKNLIVGTLRGIYMSSDEGRTWTIKFEKDNINALLVKGNLILAFTNQGICRSTDNGINWTTDNHFRALSKFTECGGYIFARNVDLLLRSTDQGKTWDTSKVPIKHFELESMIDDGKNLYSVISSSSNLFISTNKGADWNIIKKEEGLYAQTLLASEKYFFAADRYYGVRISQNKGIDWIPFNYGLGDLKVYALIAKDNILFAGTTSGVWMHQL